MRVRVRWHSAADGVSSLGSWDLSGGSSSRSISSDSRACLFCTSIQCSHLYYLLSRYLSPKSCLGRLQRMQASVTLRIPFPSKIRQSIFSMPRLSLLRVSEDYLQRGLPATWRSRQYRASETAPHALPCPEMGRCPVPPRRLLMAAAETPLIRCGGRR